MMGEVNEKEMTTLIMTVAVTKRLNSSYFVRVEVWRSRLGNKENYKFFRRGFFFFFQSVIKLHYDNRYYLSP